MARTLGPKCRICRRVGVKLFLKGTRCDTAKCPIEREARPPGQHGAKRVRMTDFGIHFREVQRAKKMYGVLQRQFARYYKEAERQPGNTGDHLVQGLERRLDNVVYRLRFGLSRDHSRQLILHGHFRVNGKKVTIPSALVEAGDIIEAAKKEKSKKLVADAFAIRRVIECPSWLKVTEEPVLSGLVVQLPTVKELQVPLESQLIVEYMSR
ncbi:MAG TPA: 30S ribosomal protein S4 [Planctomycetota bacterium]|nr:30S ribosomal protein S4 [Planctomycetota bacterium]